MGELAALTRLTPSAITYHCERLAAAGLVRTGATGREVRVSLHAPGGAADRTPRRSKPGEAAALRVTKICKARALTGGPPMTMRDRYTTPVPESTWDVPVAGAARFNWEYDDGRDRLLALYQKGKDKQWDAQKRIDWDLAVDPVQRRSALPDEFNPLVGSDIWAQDAAEGARRVRPPPGLLAVQPVPARRAGRADVLGAHRRVRARPGLEVLRRDAGDGRGAPRRAVRQVHPREDRHGLPDQPGPGQAARRSRCATAAGTCRTSACRC